MPDPPRLQGPRIRRAALPAEAVLVVRGDDLDDPETGRHQAEVFLRRFPDWGRYGLSAYVGCDSTEIDDLAADQLERFPAWPCSGSATWREAASRSCRRSGRRM